jgi:hypothetical protein
LPNNQTDIGKFDDRTSPFLIAGDIFAERHEIVAAHLGEAEAGD